MKFQQLIIILIKINYINNKEKDLLIDELNIINNSNNTNPFNLKNTKKIYNSSNDLQNINELNNVVKEKKNYLTDNKYLENKIIQD